MRIYRRDEQKISQSEVYKYNMFQDKNTGYIYFVSGLIFCTDYFACSGFKLWDFSTPDNFVDWLLKC